VKRKIILLLHHKPLNQNKMTAVEYIKEKLLGNEYWYEDMTFDQIIEQAKEMEHEQMEITWNNAIDAQLKDKWDSYDDFHKTTFKSE
jgi:hypothetical protein